MLTKILESILIHIQCASKDLQNTRRERAKRSVISFSHTLEFRPKFSGILIRALAEFPRNYIRIIEWQVFSNVETFLQISCCAFLEVLCA